jgi:hypothetical protein
VARCVLAIQAAATAQDGDRSPMNFDFVFPAIHRKCFSGKASMPTK